MGHPHAQDIIDALGNNNVVAACESIIAFTKYLASVSAPQHRLALLKQSTRIFQYILRHRVPGIQPELDLPISILLRYTMDCHEQAHGDAQVPTSCDTLQWMTPLGVELKQHLEVYRCSFQHITRHLAVATTGDGHREMASELAEVDRMLQKHCPRINNLVADDLSTTPFPDTTKPSTTRRTVSSTIHSVSARDGGIRKRLGTAKSKSKAKTHRRLHKHCPALGADVMLYPSPAPTQKAFIKQPTEQDKPGRTAPKVKSSARALPVDECVPVMMMPTPSLSPSSSASPSPSTFRAARRRQNPNCSPPPETALPSSPVVEIRIVDGWIEEITQPYKFEF